MTPPVTTRQPPKVVEVGGVVKPHGVRGELKVRPHFAGSDSLLSIDEVWLASGVAEARPFRVVSARRANRFVLLRLEGIEDMDAAEELRGARVLVSRDQLPEPGQDEFYLADLVGARVEAPSGEVGTVVEVRVHPSVDSLVIQRKDGTLVEQPLGEPWIESVDVDEACVRLSTTDGLIV